jgi:hypothetical protein
MSSSASLCNRLKDSDKQRLAAAFVNVRDQKSLMAKVCDPPTRHLFRIGQLANNISKVDWNSASLDFKPSGDITGISFKTSINRMKHTYSTLTPSDKARLAACFTSIKDPLDRLSVMGNVRTGLCPPTVFWSCS